MREALWTLVLLLAVYAAFEFLRALRLPRQGRARASVAPQFATRTPAPEAATADDERDDEDDDFLGYAPMPASAAVSSDSASSAAASARPRAGQDAGRPRPGVTSPVVASAATPSVPSPAADIEAAARFELELENSRLRQALQAQRDLVALQQTEIDRLVEDITALRDELDTQVAAVASSPEYSEAMVLAGQGLNATMIAERCGITLAEAELVLALGRDGEGRR